MGSLILIPWCTYFICSYLEERHRHDSPKWLIAMYLFISVASVIYTLYRTTLYF